MTQARFLSLLTAVSVSALVSAQDFWWNDFPQLASRSSTVNKTYLLSDFYQGEDFFADWEFFTDPDPTHGNVKYLGLVDAQAQQLAYVQDNVTVLAVDSTSNVAVGGQRNSVRITSKKLYTGGLFILDAVRMPVSCGTWPSFWSFGANWPTNGEIDVVEGVNGQPHNQMTLHTGATYTCMANAANGGTNITSSESSTNTTNTPSCDGSYIPPTNSTLNNTTAATPSSNSTANNTTSDSTTSDSTTLDSRRSDSTQTNSTSSLVNPSFTGNVIEGNCNTAVTANAGCGIKDPTPRSFGPGFNEGGGGVYALQWNMNSIKIWFFARDDVPQDIIDQNPDPESWYEPSAAWGTDSCDIPSNFHNHQLVFDITICGDWAGAASVYSASSCPGTCAQMVANATNFVDAKWIINYVAVYQ